MADRDMRGELKLIIGGGGRPAGADGPPDAQSVRPEHLAEADYLAIWNLMARGKLPPEAAAARWGHGQAANDHGDGNLLATRAAMLAVALASAVGYLT